MKLIRSYLLHTCVTYFPICQRVQCQHCAKPVNTVDGLFDRTALCGQSAYLVEMHLAPRLALCVFLSSCSAAQWQIVPGFIHF